MTAEKRVSELAVINRIIVDNLVVFLPPVEKVLYQGEKQGVVVGAKVDPARYTSMNLYCVASFACHENQNFLTRGRKFLDTAENNAEIEDKKLE